MCCRSRKNKRRQVQNLQRPLELYGKALKYYAAQNDTADWRTMLTNMAVMHRNMGDSVSAYRLNEEAIALAGKVQIWTIPLPPIKKRLRPHSISIITASGSVTLNNGLVMRIKE